MMIRPTIAALLVAFTTGTLFSTRDAGVPFHRGTLVAVGTYEQAPDGKALYEENCRKCHGVRGVPPKAMKEKFPKIALFDEAFITKRSDDSLVKVLVKGVGKAEDMKSFKDKMSPEEMLAVSKYVRELALKSRPPSTP